MREAEFVMDVDLHRPTISPVVTPVVIDDDEVHFRAGPWSGPNITVTDDDEDGILGPLVERLDGSTTARELTEAFSEYREAVEGILRTLSTKNVVVEAGMDPPEIGWNVHRQSFTDGEFHDHLAAQRPLVLGDGAVGEQVVENFLAAGVDGVDVANPVGDATAAVPARADGVRTVADVETAMSDADVAVCATTGADQAALAAVNQTALDTETSVVFVQVIGFDAIVGPTVVPGDTACYQCYRRHVGSHLERADAYEAFKEERSRRRAGPVARAFAGIAAGYATLDACSLLVGERPVLSNAVVAIDFLSYTFEPNPVLTIPNCEGCKQSVRRRIDWQRFTSELQYGTRQEE